MTLNDLGTIFYERSREVLHFRVLFDRFLLRSIFDLFRPLIQDFLPLLTLNDSEIKFFES